MRIKLNMAEEEQPSLEKPAELDILSQDDALRLAKVTAIRSREINPIDAEALYEKVVLDEISIPEFIYILRKSVKGPAYSNVLREISDNLGKFV